MELVKGCILPTTTQSYNHRPDMITTILHCSGITLCDLLLMVASGIQCLGDKEPVFPFAKVKLGKPLDVEHLEAKTVTKLFSSLQM